MKKVEKVRRKIKGEEMEKRKMEEQQQMNSPNSHKS
jgi:hypothetical protein